MLTREELANMLGRLNDGTGSGSDVRHLIAHARESLDVIEQLKATNKDSLTVQTALSDAARAIKFIRCRQCEIADDGILCGRCIEQSVQVEKLQATLAAAIPSEQEVCEWHPVVGYRDFWRASCADILGRCLDDETVKDAFRFCSYCGKPIHISESQPPEPVTDEPGDNDALAKEWGDFGTSVETGMRWPPTADYPQPVMIHKVLGKDLRLKVLQTRNFLNNAMSQLSCIAEQIKQANCPDADEPQAEQGDPTVDEVKASADALAPVLFGDSPAPTADTLTLADGTAVEITEVHEEGDRQLFLNGRRIASHSLVEIITAEVAAREAAENRAGEAALCATKAQALTNKAQCELNALQGKLKDISTYVEEEVDTPDNGLESYGKEQVATGVMNILAADPSAEQHADALADIPIDESPEDHDKRVGADGIRAWAKQAIPEPPTPRDAQDGFDEARGSALAYANGLHPEDGG